MTASTFRRRILVSIGLAVALPTMVLAGLGILLAMRISQAIDSQSARYHLYMAQQVTESFEQELLAHLRESITRAENASRAGAQGPALAATLEPRPPEFETAHLATLDELSDYFMLVVESQPLVYGFDRDRHPGQSYAGLMLRDSKGQVIGAGGWWFRPGRFLVDHLRTVMEDRLPSQERIYGGIESIRNVSVLLLGPDGREMGRVRSPGGMRNAAIEPLTGPFEGFAVRVTSTPFAPDAWTRGFVITEVTFIGLMGLAVLAATWFGLRYTAHQIELARIKSSFVSNVSHELKTPISLIRLAVETLEMRRFASPEEGEKFLRRISRETQRLNQLVDNILDFARLEAGQRTFRFAPVDVLEMIHETVDSFRLRLEDQGFALEVDLPDELPPVRGDAHALSQCVLNLLDNAMKYSRGCKEVRVSARAVDERVAISVSDRGIGISPHDQRRIFEKFVRLETGLVHDVKGAGLGLSLVDQIVRAHGGHVEVSSVPGEGSTFTLVLPAGGEAQSRRIEPTAQTGS